MKKASPSLRRKLLVWLLVPLISVFLIRAAHTYFVTSVSIATQVYDRMLTDIAKSLAQQVTYNQRGGAVLNLSSAAAQILMSDDYDQVFFSVRDDTGLILASNAAPIFSLPSHRISDHPLFFNSVTQGKAVRVITFTLHPSPKHKDRFVIVEVAETLNKRQRLAKEIVSNSLLPQALIILLAPLIVWIGIGKGLAPLRVLQRDVARRSHLNLSPVEEGLAPKEVRPIIHAINDLMERLGHVLEAQNRFAADAAHQLRTPLAGLKAQVELVARQATLDDMRAATQPLSVSIDRMSRLVNQLLALARSDHESGHASPLEPIDLNILVSDTTREWVPEALQKDIDLGFVDSTLPATIHGNPQRLRELISNLLDNAIRYTPKGGRITTRVLSNPPSLLVEDNGDGIPPQERERVFERFYRVLGSRAEGSGLGLAIVHEIAQAHGATVRLGSNVRNKGTVVTIEFPLPKY